MENNSYNNSHVWLFYAASEQRGAKWLEQSQEGGFVFWRHGNDAYNRTMRPGDTALIYLAGTQNYQPQIVAVATIAAIRTPFILDNDQKVQRIPAMIVRDLRNNPIGLDQLAKYTGENNLKLVRGQGAVHPVDNKVVQALSSLINLDLPLTAHEYLDKILDSNLWNEIVRFGDNFTVFENYISARKRKQFDPESATKVTSEEHFTSLIKEGWKEPNTDIGKITTNKPDPLESKAEATVPESESNSRSQHISPPSKTVEFKSPGSDSDLIDNIETTSTSDLSSGQPQRDNFRPGYSGNGILTASGIADRVTMDARDHLRVEKEAQAFARLIASVSSKPPLSIGIFGRWGSGKTFFMSKISKELENISNHNQNGFHSNIVQVDFNAWHYMETNIWASLVDVIFKRLDEEISDHKDENNDKVSLFDQLSTSQNLRLEAIENLAKKTQDANAARLAVTEARAKYRKYGPNGKAIWSLIYKQLFTGDGKIDNADLEKTAKLFGIKDFNLDVESLHTLSNFIKKSQQQGHLAIHLLRKQAISPLSATLFTGVLICFALSQMGIHLFSWFPKLNLQATLSTIVAAISTWGASVLVFANRAISLIEKVGSGLSKAEQLAVSEQQAELDQAELALEEANRNLELAEKSADTAYQALAENSPGAQLATFIRQRSESDDYSKHLGVIATIRKDFEQLSALMSKESNNKTNTIQKENTPWQDIVKFRKNMNTRIDQLEEKYSNILFDKSNTLEKVRIKNAIAQLRKTLLKPTEIEQPFSRIVLKVDDLDRCPPEKVADVLQAIHLFLNFPLFVVLVCVDERWMSSSLITKYKGLVDGSSGSTTRDYLEKIFQIPYWTRSMSMEASGDFAKALVAGIPHTNHLSSAQISPEPGLEDVQNLQASKENVEITDNNDGNKDTEAYTAATYDEMEEPATEDIPAEHEQSFIAGEQVSNGEFKRKPEVSTNGESSNSKTQYTPLSLTVEEREFLTKVAGFAGHTPRHTLRFVNVYLLIKSSIETDPDAPDFVDLQGHNFGYQALLIQLSLATRADAITDLFFQTLQKLKFSREKGLNTFLNIFEKKIYDNNTVQLSVAEQQTCEKLIDFVLDAADSLESNKKSDSRNRYSLLSASPYNEPFLEDLFRTYYLARRYTFAPPPD